MGKDNAEVREYFDDWAGNYDRMTTACHWEGPRRVFEAARPYLCKDSRILDVAIGTGLLSAQFRKAAAGVIITGLDISAGMLEECADKRVADTLKRCDIEHRRFPLPRDSTDLTVASGVFELLGTLQNVFSEMARVTRPGGVIAFSYIPNSGSKTKRYHFDDGVPLYSHSSRKIEGLMRGFGVEMMAHSRRFTGYNPGHAFPNRVFVGRVL